uniref:Uncharacterized protein n=1 Tax=Anguilla anguilla TaxID=7936 RepID=A0A0E9TGQ8_ANGAN
MGSGGNVFSVRKFTALN